jgi:hypothetical protein
MPLSEGGSNRSRTLGTGTSRSRTLVIGRAGRSRTVPAPLAQGAGISDGLAVVLGDADYIVGGNSILQETSDRILLETGEYLLIEDAALVGLSAGFAGVIGYGASFADGQGLSAGNTTPIRGVGEVPSVADNLLKEDGDDILLETGDFLLLEDGTVAPSSTLLDANNTEILDTNGDFMEAA